MADRYRSFAALAAAERLDEDYRIVVEDRHSPVVILAPHGGWIEGWTSDIARAIAGEKFSLYLFEGCRRGRPHGDLHITSTLFDEPLGTALVRGAVTAVAIHGRADGGDPGTVHLGGGHVRLRDEIGATLLAAGFPVAIAHDALAGRNPANICNRGKLGAGAQLELPRGLREQLAGDPVAMGLLGDAVRTVLQSAEGL
jgi:phage replication-related protein YjqB (UPF0714/DUF867 family)